MIVGGEEEAGGNRMDWLITRGVVEAEGLKEGVMVRRISVE